MENTLNSKFIKILSDQSGQRLDNFLKKFFRKDVPKSLIYKMIRKGLIKVNEKKTKHFYKILHKDKIKLPSLYLKEKKYKINWENIKKLNNQIIYEDNYIIGINKPSGMAVHGGSGISLGLIEKIRLLKEKTKFLELVHRIDRDTSGILLIAKKSSILRKLHEQMCARKIKKKYTALVHGYWSDKTNIIQAPLIEKRINNKKKIYVNYELGKISITKFKVKKHFKKIATLVNIMPITGRTHQIRVHTNYNGNPIVYDEKYGDKKSDKNLKKIGLKRLFLHAHSLTFNHPYTNKLIKIKAPIDKNLKNCILYLENNYS